MLLRTRTYNAILNNIREMAIGKSDRRMIFFKIVHVTHEVCTYQIDASSKKIYHIH
jgi:hypothetical protein